MEWIEKAQAELQRQELAGWLLYDFRGSNPVANRFIGLGGLITRRVFLFVPANGEPTLLVHGIERGSLPEMPVRVATYTSRESLQEELRRLLPQGPIAMEYSPQGDNPYLSLVDAGTVELVRELGVTPVSSGDLLQAFDAWTEEQLRQHEQAARGVYRARDKALAFIARRVGDGKPVTEYEVQQVISAQLDDSGLVFDHPAIVGFGPNSGDPHYAPPATGSRALQEGDAILLDIFAKVDGEDAPYADITWMAAIGEPGDKLKEVFAVVSGARDAAFEAIERAYAEGRQPSGSEIDRAAREYVERHGYGDHFIHRTGHSLGTRATHGDAVHLDDFETRDERKLLPGVGVTIEPGVYLPEFGVRSEINVYMDLTGPRVTTEPQRELTSVLPGKVRVSPHEVGISERELDEMLMDTFPASDPLPWDGARTND